MGVGFHSANTANPMLDAEITSPAWFQLHTGDPGSAGTANQSAVTTRQSATLGAAASGVRTMTGTDPSWSMTATETLTHVSKWSASSGGSVEYTFALASSVGVVNGVTFTLTDHTVGFASGSLMS